MAMKDEEYLKRNILAVYYNMNLNTRTYHITVSWDKRNLKHYFLIR